jgi:hypothetical protein
LEVLEAMTAPSVDGQPSLPKQSDPKGLLATRQSTYRGIARTYGVEQSELISRLDTFATKKRKA